MIIDKSCISQSSTKLLDYLRSKSVDSISGLEGLVSKKSSPVVYYSNHEMINIKKKRMSRNKNSLNISYVNTKFGSIIDIEINDETSNTSVTIRCSDSLEGYETTQTLTGNDKYQRKYLVSNDFSDLRDELKRLSELR